MSRLPTADAGVEPGHVAPQPPTLAPGRRNGRPRGGSGVERRLSGGTVAKYGLLLFLAVGILYPLGMLIYGSFSTAPPGVPGELTTQWYRRSYTAPGFGRVLYNTVFFSAAKLFFAAIIGGGLGFLVARTDLPGRSKFEVLGAVPFFTPAFLTAIAWSMLANPRNGVINTWFASTFGTTEPVVNIHSMAGMVFHGTQGTAALFFLLTIGAFKSLNAEMEEASRSCGATKLQTFRSVVVPTMLPALSGALLLIFIKGLESFQTPLVLGRPAGIYVLSTEIYRYLMFRSPAEYGSASAIAMGLLFLTLVLMLLQWKLIAKKSFVTFGGKGHSTRPMELGRWKWPAFALVMAYFFVSVFIPVGFLALSSLTPIFGVFDPSMFTFANWSQVLSNDYVIRALQNTAWLAFGAAFVCVLLASIMSFLRIRTNWWGGRAMDVLSWIPWSMPGLVLALGFLWAAIFFPGPITLYGTFALLILAYVINGLPLAARVMSGTIVQIGPSLEEAARICGATWLRAFRDVTLRLVRVGFIAAWAVLAYAIIGNLELPALLSVPGTNVMATAILRLWSDGSTSVVAVVAVIVLVAVMILASFEHWTRRRYATDASQTRS